MKYIDADRALELLRAAVEEKGEDHKVSDCFYVVDGEPYCIVGVALYKNGVKVDELEGDYSEKNSCTINFRDDLYSDMSKDACRIFNAAQRSQDLRNTWGEALEVAVAKYESIKGEK